MEAVRRSDPLRTLYSGVSDSMHDDAGRRRESRRLLAEAVRIHVEDPERALATLASVPVPLPRDARTTRFIDLVADGVLFKAQNRLRSVDPKGAIELLRRIPQNATSYLDAQLLLGETFLQLRQSQAAQSTYEAARTFDPKSFDAAAGLARAMQINQNYREAEKLWSEVASLRPDLSAPHVQRALCLMRLERLDDARAACRKALEINPQDTRASELLKDLGKP
jgi:tetratricopeptide (TPR) repeat protein